MAESHETLVLLNDLKYQLEVLINSYIRKDDSTYNIIQELENIRTRYNRRSHSGNGTKTLQKMDILVNSMMGDLEALIIQDNIDIAFRDINKYTALTAIKEHYKKIENRENLINDILNEE